MSTLFKTDYFLNRKVLLFFCFFTGMLAAIAQPTITSFSPTNGEVGTTITITGTGFSTTAANNIVYFGGIGATVTSATATALSVVVPNGSARGFISVTTGGLTAITSKDFNLINYNIASINTSPLAFYTNTFTLSSVLSSYESTTTNDLIVGVGDFDNDGWPDIYKAGPNSLRVNRNLLTGTNTTLAAAQFSASLNFTVTGSVRTVAVTDIDSDGKLDIITGSDFTISILRNTSTPGNISFANAVNISTSTTSIRVADFDYDGKIDIAAVNSNVLNIYKNTSTSGTITFTEVATALSTTGFNGIDIGDLNNDGKIDLVVSKTGATNIFTNNSTNGTLSLSSSITLAIGHQYVIIDDLDKDGKNDIYLYNKFLKSNYVSGTLTSSNFTTNTNTLVDEGASGSTSVDLNGDGYPEVLLGAWWSHYWLYVNNATGTPASIFTGRQTFVRGHGAAVDLNGDQKVDMITSGAYSANSNEPNIGIYQNSMAPTEGITVSCAFSAFGQCGANTNPSANQTMTVSGSTLTSNILIGAATNFEYSLDNITYSATLNIPHVTGTVAATTVYVRYNRTDLGSDKVNIPISSSIAAGTRKLLIAASGARVLASIAGAATVCSGTNSTLLTLNGHTGTVTRWESSASSTFASGITNIANTTTSLTATNLSATTYYRAVLAGGTCGAINSDPVTITVVPTAVGGSISGAATVCTGTNSTALTLSGHTGTISKWQSSTSSTFASGVTDIANTTTTYTATNLSATTYFRAVIINGSCTANSAQVMVTVSPTSVAGFISGAAVVCSGTNSTTLTLSGNTGSITRWESSASSTFASGITNIANTTTSFTAINLSATTYYRAVVTSGSCAAVNTPAVTMAVTIKPVVTNTTATACSGGTFTVTPTTGSGNTVPSGTRYTWTVADNANVTGEAAVTSSQNQISQTLTNTSTTNQTVVYTVTPKNTGAGSDYSVGSTFNGGVIAYIFQPTDYGYSAGKVLIVKPQYLTGGTTCGSTAFTLENPTASTSTNIGEGLNNTNNLYNAGHTSTTQAIGLAYNYTDGTYSDWFIPSKDELGQVFANVSSSFTNNGFPIRTSSEIPGNLSTSYAYSIGNGFGSQNDVGCASVVVTRYDILPILPTTCDGATFTVTVTVNSPSVGGSISGAATVCAGTNSTTVTLSGITGNVTRWESSLDNFATAGTPIVNTTTTLTATNLSTTTYYRAVVTNGSCAAAYSTSVTVTVTPTSVSGSISGDATVCSGTNSTTLTLSGNTGSITRWEASLDNFTTAGTPIANTTTTYTATNLAATTYYRAVVTSGSCAAANSAAAIVAVNASLGGTVAGATTVCTGTNSTTLTLSGNTGSITSWESSLDNFATAGTTIANTTTTYTATNLAATTYFRAVVTNGSCAAANSAAATITVSPTSVAGAITGAATVCSGTNSTVLTLSGNTGSVTRWEASSDNFATAGTPIANTTTTFTATNLTALTYYRAVVTSGSCTAATSASVTMAVTFPPVVTNKTASICSGQTFTVAPTSGSGNTVPAGTTYTWTVADNTNVTGESAVSSAQSQISQTLTNNVTTTQTVVYTVTPKNAQPTIGSTFNGGVIAYIFQPTDNGYAPGKVLIVKPQYLTGGVVCGSTAFLLQSPTASTSTNIGEGLNNTNNLYNAGHTSTLQAIGLAYNYTDGTYSDWFIPSKDELNQVFTNVSSSITNNGFRIRTSSEIPTDLTTSYAYAIGTGFGAQNDGGCASVLVTRYDTLPTACEGTPFTVTVTVTNNTWLGTTSSAWTTASNWSCGSVPTATSNVIIASSSNQPIISSAVSINSLTINAGTTVTVNSGFNLTVTNAVANSGTMTLQNNANLLQDTAAVTNINSGSITVKRNSASLLRLDHTLWSSPVASQNLFSFSPATLTNRFYIYDTALNVYSTTGLSGATTFAAAKGYAVRAPNNHSATTPTTWTGTFTGVPNNGTVPFTLSTAGSGFNLVGNPYPSPINASAFLTANSSLINGTLYFYAHSLTMDSNGVFPSGTNYCSWNGAAGTAATTAASGDFHPIPVTPNGVIQVGQGFFVKATASGTINFTNTMRVGNNANQFLRTTEIERHRLWLNLTTENDTDINQIAVAYVEGATQNADANFDGLSFGNNGSALSSKIDADDYVIQGRSLPFDSNDVVALGFKAATAGNYKIILTNKDGLFLGNQEVFVRDNLMGIEHNIKVAPYLFASQEGTFDGRFQLVYTQALGTPSSTFTPNSVLATKNSDGFHVTTTGSVMKDILVYDIAGRLLFKQTNINGTATVLKGLSQTKQVLLLKITSQENETVTVKVIN